jgi:hypothetical protein
MWEQHLRNTAAWLVEMADNPLTSGSKGHAAHRLQELMASSPLYADLPRYIREARAGVAGPPPP